MSNNASTLFSEYSYFLPLSLITFLSFISLIHKISSLNVVAVIILHKLLSVDQLRIKKYFILL